MKKPVKITKKLSLPKKRPRNVKKKNVKTVYSDALRAFILVGILVIFSASVSTAVIMVHAALKNPAPGKGAVLDPDLLLPQTIEPVVPTSASPSAFESSKPVVSVSVQQPISMPQAGASPGRNVPVTSVPRAAPEKPPENVGTLVFVIDDAGNNLRELEPFLRIPFPLTIAVLPGLSHSAEAARRIRAAGKEVFLHQPMEALGGQDPGPGAIYSGMSGDEIRSILKRNIAEIGPVAGINNHQGSKVTMDRTMMDTVLAFCAEQGLCFLDSRTTAETAVPAAAKSMSIKIGQRDVFIDNEQDAESMLHFISGGLGRARQNGSAVLIGHTWSPELAPLLAEQFPLLIKQGYSIKTASDIIK
jgi:polysaccharide deacetylase 2 family uncharacterized protein YibQ